MTLRDKCSSFNILKKCFQFSSSVGERKTFPEGKFPRHWWVGIDEGSQIVFLSLIGGIGGQ